MYVLEIPSLGGAQECSQPNHSRINQRHPSSSKKISIRRVHFFLHSLQCLIWCVEEYQLNDSREVLPLKHTCQTTADRSLRHLPTPATVANAVKETHLDFFHRGVMRISGLRGRVMKREKRERRQINTDRAVIKKKEALPTDCAGLRLDNYS